MKKYLAIIFILMLIPVANAYSFSKSMENIGEFLREYFVWTGNAILGVKDSLKQIKKEEAESASAAPPEVKKVDETASEPVADTIDISEKNKNVQGEEQTEEVETQFSHTPSCSDYVDNNVNYYKKGVCSDSLGKYVNGEYPTDRCNDDNTMVLEYSCVQDYCSGSWFVCPNGCRDGACIDEGDVSLNADIEVVGIVFNPEHPSINEVVDINARIKNVGTKGSKFERTYVIGAVKDTEFVDYFLEPGETIEIDLTDMAFSAGKHEVTVSVGNSSLTEVLEVGLEENGQVTGEVVKENQVEETFLSRVISLLLGAFR